MTFASDIQKPSSERFFLVQITPRRDITPGTFVSGSDYSFTLLPGTIVSAVYVNGSSATFSQSGETLTVTSASNLASSSNKTVIDHELYLTGTLDRETSSVAGLPDAIWKARLEKYPTVSQSMRNIAEGVFTLSSSTISVIATDGFYQSISGPKDSLSNAPVKVWACVDTVESNKVVFNGEVTSLAYSNGLMTLTVSDVFNKLLKTSTFGSFADAYNYAGNPDRPYVEQENENKAIPITIGYSSPVQVSPGWRHLDPWPEPPGFTSPYTDVKYHVSGGLTAVKYSPSIVGPTSSVTFSAGRILGGLKYLNFGSVINSTRFPVVRQIENPVTNTLTYFYDDILYVAISSHDCQIGDYIPGTYLPGGLPGWVCGLHSIGSTPVLAIAQPDYSATIAGFGGSFPSPSTPSNPTFTSGVIPAITVWIDGGESFNNEIFIDGFATNQRLVSHATRYVPFTLSTDTYTHAGETITHVSFTVDPVAAKLIIPDTTQDTQNPLISRKLKYAYRTNNPVTHAEGIEFICKSAGLDVSSMSISSANAALTGADLSMSIPLEQNGDFQSYLKACQAITTSTLGVLAVNEDREIEYKVLDTIVTPDYTRDSTDLLQGEQGSAIDFQDIATQIKMENPHLKSLEGYDDVLTNISAIDGDAEFLHRVSSVKTVFHYFKSASSVISRIAGYFKNPTVQYNIASSSKDLNTVVGDIVEITNPAAASTSGVASGVVVSVDSSGTKTNIILNELRGL